MSEIRTFDGKMYERTFWKDHVTDQSGAVIQQGTLLDQSHFNKIEEGVSDAHIALNLLLEGYLHLRRTQEHNDAEVFAEILGETHTVTLTNIKSYPFNSTISTPTTVALTKNRRNLYYSVEATVTAVSGGLAGDIHITNKALNGFKVSFDGSAKSVTVELRIKGGMA